MKFNKRKFNLIVCFVMVLICVTVAFSSIAVEKSVTSGINAEENQENVDNFDKEENTQDNKDCGNSSTTDNSETDDSNNESEVKEIGKAPSFSNAWAVYYYALEKDKVIPSYQIYSQKVHAEASGYPVTVDFSTKRNIFDQITNISVINAVSTVIDLGNLGINVNDGKNWTSYSYFDLEKETFNEVGNYELTFAEGRKKYPMFVWEVPCYEINESTATARLSNPPKLDYYEVTFVLKSNAWQGYRNTLKESIGRNCKQLPNIQSITIKVKINKTYGTFMSFEMVENFTAIYSYNSLDIQLDCVSLVFLKYSYNDSRIASGAEEVKSHLPKFNQQ